jgi:predicted HAD superfamily Cof-like phosphohydrolase
MTKEQRMVLEFHKAFGITYNDTPTLPELSVTDLRLELIEEELDELVEAIGDGDLVAIADALADMKYVIDGAACAFGIDLEPIMEEVHRSNMSKVGGHKSASGKWVKPDTYSPANLKPILVSQGMTP